MAAFEAWLVFRILVVNVVGELQRKRTLAASRGFLAAARLSCNYIVITPLHSHSLSHATSIESLDGWGGATTPSLEVTMIKILESV